VSQHHIDGNDPQVMAVFNKVVNYINDAIMQLLRKRKGWKVEVSCEQDISVMLFEFLSPYADPRGPHHELSGIQPCGNSAGCGLVTPRIGTYSPLVRLQVPGLWTSTIKGKNQS
jgi:hypothetical protein